MLHKIKTKSGACSSLQLTHRDQWIFQSFKFDAETGLIHISRSDRCEAQQSGSEEDDDDYDHNSFPQERTSGLVLPQPNPPPRQTAEPSR